MHTFWSLVVEPGKIYKNVVESGVQITRAALDTSTATEKDEGLCQITLTHEGKKMTIGNLSIKHGCFQTQLDLIFQCGEEIAFSTSGAKLPVTLTGVSGVDDDDSEDDEDYMIGESTLDELDDTVDESLDEIEPPQLVGKKRKIKPVSESAAKAMKLASGDKKSQAMTLNDETLQSEDSDDDSYNPGLNDSSMLGEEEEEDSDLDEEMEDEESDDMGEEGESDEGSDEELDEEEDEEESDEEMEESPVKPQQPKKSVMNGNHQEKSKKLKVQTPEQKSTPKPSKVEKLKARENKAATTPTMKGKDTPSKKEGKTPKGEKKSKLENKENLEAKATPKQDKKNKEGKTPKGEKKTPSKQNRAGGVVIEDITVGSGNAAKSNNMVR